jgi:tryptophanyl-tRNA synthetase
MTTIFSGIQPTGNLHLGNYLGSIANWTALQKQHQCLFGIMNLHAITLPQDPKELKANVINCAITYLAAGLDPQKSIVFIQSEVKEHAELAWILGCITPLGWLNRMTQFKEKSPDNENLGLYAYPDLMAADILLYRADLVPTGEDQKQHLELARDIAGAFNRQYQSPFFKLPEPMILGNCKRIMSLIDGTKKMSKSTDSDLSRINLSDEAELIEKKIKKAKTDSIAEITYDSKRPEIYNLLNIFSAAISQDPAKIAQDYANSGMGKFKADMAEALIANLAPLQTKIKELQNNCDYVEKILHQGRAQAQAIASKTIDEIKKIIGINFL